MKKKKTSTTEVIKENPIKHRYDKIWRENLRAALPGLIEKVLKIKVTHSEVSTDKLQVTRQRETDGLWKVTDANGSTFVLHIEVQVSGSEPDMANRMATYRIMARQTYALPVKQYVLYLDDGAPSLPTTISEPGLSFEYALIRLNSLPYKLFLSSDKT